MDVNIKIPSLSYIPVLLQLSLYSFKLKIDDGEEIIRIKNIDGTETSHKMSVSDIVYLTETGTLTTPPRPIIKNIEEAISKKLEIELPRIIDGIIKEYWEMGRVIGEFYKINIEINSIIIPQEINKMLASNNSINNIIGTKNEDTTYIYDLKKLQKFIHCEFLIG